jgi:hypothetical protein
VQSITATCNNEDINANGILDADEDENNDDQLTPGNVVAIQSDGITDDNGQVQFIISYPRSFGAWVDVSITANGQSQGSESSEQRNHALGVAAADLTVQGNPPPVSPFGVGANCNDNN